MLLVAVIHRPRTRVTIMQQQSCTRQVRLTERAKNTETKSFSPVGLLCKRRLSAPREHTHQGKGEKELYRKSSRMGLPHFLISLTTCRNTDLCRHEEQQKQGRLLSQREQLHLYCMGILRIRLSTGLINITSRQRKTQGTSRW